MKFTKTSGKGKGPTGAEEPCVTYTVTGDDGKVIAQRVQWPTIKEGSDEEVAARPHFWGDRGWKFATLHAEDGKLALYGFAKDQAHVDRLKAKSAKDKATGFTVVGMS